MPLGAVTKKPVKIVADEEQRTLLSAATLTENLKAAEQSLAKVLAETRREEDSYVSARLKLYSPRDFAAEQRWFMLTDAMGLLLGFACAWALALIINVFVLSRIPHSSLMDGGVPHLIQFLVISFFVLLWFEHTDHYRVRMPFWLEVKRIIGVLGLAMMVDGFFQFASKEDISRLWLVSSWFFSGIFIMSFRSVLRHERRKKGIWQVPTLLIGAGATAEDTLAALRSEPGLGYEVTKSISDLPGAFRKAGESWKNLCALYGAEYVVIALDGPDLAKAELPLAQLLREEMPFSVSPPLRHMPVFGMMPHYFFNHDVMLMTRSNGLEQPVPRLIKRCFDILVASVTLLIISPLFVALALLVKLDGGPAFFGQKRLGRGGKTFTCLKFRSMVPEAEKVLGKYLAENAEARKEFEQYYKLKNDPRITRLGKVLRRLSLDELPQLLNVLKGDMSLVGPRPILAAEESRYNSDIAFYYKVRPGITGLWQVSGRNDVPYAQRVRMDGWYVRNWSLWHDIAILFKTIPVIFKIKGAY